MLRHIFFLILYIALYSFAGGITMSIALLVHCSLMLYNTIRDKKPINPLILYAVSVIIVSLSNILLILDVDNHSISLYYYIVANHIDEATLIWCVGNCAIFIGYDLVKNRTLPLIDVEIKSSKTLSAIFWILFILSFRRIFISDSDLGSFGKLFNITSSIGILFFARIWGRDNSKTYRNYSIALLVVQTSFSILFSFLRLELISPTICMFIGYQIGKGDFKAIFSYKTLPYVVILYAFSQFFVFFGKNRTHLDSGAARLEQLSDVNSLAAEDQTLDKTSKENSGVADRAANLAQLTNVVELVDRKGFYEGRASAPLLIALIPRIFWPEKPTIAMGSWFATEIGQGMKADDKYNNSINMTIPGNIFLDFGWLGMGIGCMLTGMLLALFWNSTRFNNSLFNITGILFGGYLLVISLTGMGADLEILVTFLFYYIVFFIVKKLA